jgi:hypothetical protein
MYQCGSKEYYINGHRHRLEGPAIVYTDEYIAYYVDGLLHRLNGPSIVDSYGNEQYWQNGKRIL